MRFNFVKSTARALQPYVLSRLILRVYILYVQVSTSVLHDTRVVCIIIQQYIRALTSREGRVCSEF